jgi:GNAT superfamily N-acetyltransferase
MERIKISIRPAIEKEIEWCLNLERRLNESRPQAKHEGFLLSSGESLSDYLGYHRLGSFLVAEKEGALIGFLFALPPKSERIVRLSKMKDKFTLMHGYGDVFERAPVAWLAKVGIAPEWMRNGVASSLYEKLFSTRPDWNFLTTTVESPEINLPSLRLQEKFGFKKIGMLALGSRGAFKDIVCAVHTEWLKQSRDGSPSCVASQLQLQ